LWPVFFDLFEKYWPGFDGRIVLNTEELGFEHPGLDIQCTKVGRLGSFGKVFRAGLARVPSNNVLLIMIDYFFMGPVDEAKLQECFAFFAREDLDSFCLMPFAYKNTAPAGVLDFEIVVPPSYDMFSFQVAFWKKNVLREMVLPHESPWLSEWYGTARANLMKVRLAVSGKAMPIQYLAEGALHKGRWVSPMVEFLDGIKYRVDYLPRGFFVEHKASLYGRLVARYKTFWPRFLSNADLLRRRFASCRSSCCSKK
jgi:hypothetical protein